MLSPQLKARSVERADVIKAGRRVIPIEKPTLPPVDVLAVRTWFVLHVAPGREWTARRELRRSGYDVYLPVAARWVVTRRIKRAIETSLLTRYVFVGLTAEQMATQTAWDEAWAGIRDTEGVGSVLGWGGLPSPVPEAGLVDLVERQMRGAFDQTLGPVFEAGDEVVVERDTLSGRRGIVQDLVPARTPAERGIRLLMHMFGGSAFVHIPLANLRRV